MFHMIKNSSVVAIIFCTCANVSFSQESNNNNAGPTDKTLITGITSVATLPFFPNLLPNLGYQQYYNRPNMGFQLNAEYLIRLKLDNFMILLTQVGAYKKINRNGRFPMELGGSLGIGVNSLPNASFLAAAFVAIPVWKLKLKCQPTLVLPSLKSSYIGLNLAYPFQLSSAKSK